MSGAVSVCDPYTDPRTIDFLADCTGATSLRLLTHNVNRQTAVARDARSFRTQHGKPLDIRIDSGGQLHDRYAIDDRRMVLFGTSLNSIGNKQSFVVQLGPDVRAATLAAFERAWAAASPL
jgi:hypothetical protein